MSWWTNLTDTIGKALENPATMGLASLGTSALAKEFGFSDTDVPVVGYQGSIPKYEAVRERVPMPADPNRRPGSGGRRYFSDVIYADRPERQPMSVAQAREQAGQQAQGLAALNQPPKMAGGGRYLDGATDGMADVVPADVVSHLGNGNSDAGAKQLHAMMTRIRKERTGNPKQGKQIKPQTMLPA